MTEKEYNAACDNIVRQYFQQEDRIISEKKRTGVFGMNPEKDYILFLRLNQDMRRQLQALEKQYLSQHFQSEINAMQSPTHLRHPNCRSL